MFSERFLMLPPDCGSGSHLKFELVLMLISYNVS